MRRTMVLLVALALIAACSKEPGVSDPLADATLAPARTDPSSASVVVIGDFGVGGSRERAVAAAIRERATQRPLDALVTTGDNIYPSGAPGAFENAWHRPYGWLARAGVPIVASLGNHDVRTGNGEPVMQLFGMPARWYARRIGPIEFIVLEANRAGDPEQLVFLEQTARASTAPWQVVVFHQPAFSCGKHGSTPEIQQRWVPLFERTGVDLILSGHDHSYQRFDAIDGVPYIVTGGGGAPLTGIGRCPVGTPRPRASFVQHHFVVLEATPDRLGAEAVSVLTGEVADRASFRQLTPAGPSPTVGATPTPSGGAG